MSETTMTLKKVAWIRDEGYPVGKPAPGRLNCPCGNAPVSSLSPDNGDVHCPCGRVYRWDGWLREKPPEYFIERLDGKPEKIDWTKVGYPLVPHEARDKLLAITESIDRATEALPGGFECWLKLSDKPLSLSFMAGEGIKSTIKEFKIPRVSAVAVSVESAPYGLYGIRGHYDHGCQRVEHWVMDTGDGITPILSKVYPKDEAVKEFNTAPKFKVGDRVVFTNSQGVSFPGKIITKHELRLDGYAKGHAYFITPTDSPWFIVPERQLSPEKFA